MNDTVSLAAAKAIVDDIVSNQGVGIFLFHGLEAVAGSYAWAIDDLDDLIAYIIASGVPIITMSDLWALRSGDIVIPVAV